MSGESARERYTIDEAIARVNQTNDAVTANLDPAAYSFFLKNMRLGYTQLSDSLEAGQSMEDAQHQRDLAISYNEIGETEGDE